MLDFIYDSLDTVKKLKFPTTKQVAQLTLGIFALVIVAGAYFILVDTLATNGYKALYTKLTGKEIQAAYQMLDADSVEQAIDLSGLNMVLSGTETQEVPAETVETSVETETATPAQE